MDNQFISGSFAADTNFPSNHFAEELLENGKIKKAWKNLSISIVTSMLIVLSSHNVSAKVSPSFDCTKAKTDVEKLICADDQLAKLDFEMNKSYHAFMKTLDEKFYRNKLRKKQINWLGYRGKLGCFNTDNAKKTACLKNLYKVRISDLNAWAERKNYNFFRDYLDVTKKESIAKVMDSSGHEFMVNCSGNIIYPDFPSQDQILLHNNETMKYVSVPAYTHYEDNNIYIYCESTSPYIPNDYQPPVFEKADFENPNPMKRYGDFYYARDNDFEVLQEILKEKITPLVQKGGNEKICKAFWNNLSADKVLLVTPIISNSFEELKDKANLNCSRQQFENLIDKQTFLVEPYVFHRTSKGNILEANYIDLRPQFDTQILGRKICFLNDKTCHCNNFADFYMDNISYPYVKIDNQYFILEVSKHDSETLWVSFKKLSNPIEKNNLELFCSYTITEAQSFIKILTKDKGGVK